MKKFFAFLIVFAIAMATIVVAVGFNPDSDDGIVTLSNTNSAPIIQPVSSTVRYKSSISNMTENSTFGPAPSFITNGNRVVTTEKGSYIAYMELEDIVAMGRGKFKPALNRFSLHKLTDDGTYSYIVGYGYTWDGDIDLLANSQGDVFIMCGHSSFEEHYVLPNHIADAEKVTLSAFMYETDTEHLVNNGNIRYLEEGYSTIRYVTAAIDRETDKIYSVFTSLDSEGQNVLEYFIFDTITRRWEKGSTKISIPVAPNNAYAYISNGFNMIYEVDGVIRLVNDDVTEIGTGVLQDVYPTEDGNVHVLSLANGANNYTYTIIESGNAASYDIDIPFNVLVTMTEQDGNLSLLTLSKGTTVTLTIYNLSENIFTESHKVVMGQGKIPYGQFMVSRPLSGSIEKDNLTVMFSATQGSDVAWFFGLAPSKITE